jgi:hypothetical protein
MERGGTKTGWKGKGVPVGGKAKEKQKKTRKNKRQQKQRKQAQERQENTTKPRSRKRGNPGTARNEEEPETAADRQNRTYIDA